MRVKLKLPKIVRAFRRKPANPEETKFSVTMIAKNNGHRTKYTPAELINKEKFVGARALTKAAIAERDAVNRTMGFTLFNNKYSSTTARDFDRGHLGVGPALAEAGVRPAHALKLISKTAREEMDAQRIMSHFTSTGRGEAERKLKQIWWDSYMDAFIKNNRQVKLESELDKKVLEDYKKIHRPGARA